MLHADIYRSKVQSTDVRTLLVTLITPVISGKLHEPYFAASS
jgi:hypothetical protein